MQGQSRRIPTIQIIVAPSSLGLKNKGVERLAQGLLACGLKEKLQSASPVVHVPTLNHLHSNQRDERTKCLNANAIHDFSYELAEAVSMAHEQRRFALVLGGDCSIVLGVMAALKRQGNFALIFIDAHADFYDPDTSTTGEVADMDLAIVTGRGPETLTNMHGLRPYVRDENVVHIGQRDQLQAAEFGSPDIRKTSVQCYSLQKIRDAGIMSVADEALSYISTLSLDGFWIHFDTDVLADDVNPAVDYRLPGGLRAAEATLLLKKLLETGRAVGMTVSIYNPDLDPDGTIAATITECVANAFL